MIDERLKKIESMREQIRTTAAEKAEKTAALGKVLWEKKGKTVKSKPLERIFREIDGTDREITLHNDTIRDIRENTTARAETENRLAALKEEIKTADGTYQEAFEGLGRAAYGAFKEGHIDGSSFPALFDDIDGITAVLEGGEDELERITRATDPETFFKRIAGKSRTVLMSTKVRAARNRLERAYRKLGKELCASVSPEGLEEMNASDVFEPYRGCIDGMAGLKKREQELSEEMKRLDERLSGLDALKNGKRRIEELEKKIETGKLSMKELCLAAGTAYLGDSGKEPSGDKDPASRDLRQGILELDKTIEKLEEDISAAETSLRIEGLRARADEKEEAIQTARKKIEKLNAEIKEQQKLKKQLLSEIRHLEESIGGEGEE